MQNHLEIWKRGATPDPAYVKAFKRGGGFSGKTVNPTYMVKVATEIFGPIGQGWGWEILDEDYRNGAPFLNEQGSVICNEVIHIIRLRLWYEWDGKKGEVIHYGQTLFVGKNKFGLFTDEEAPKKSITDAMMKCFSMLGLGADIHMGLFDDSKYVNDVRKRKELEMAESAKSTGAERLEEITGLFAAVSKAAEGAALWKALSHQERLDPRVVKIKESWKAELK